ncbi:MAG: MAPEG family protein [Burkholderiales bacterium]|nr:MAPEG family protein [Burkholderiales bacterium]
MTALASATRICSLRRTPGCGVFLYWGLRFVTGTPINQLAPFGQTGQRCGAGQAHGGCPRQLPENLPVFAVIVLAAAAISPESIAALAPFVLYARIGQSIVHLVGVGQAHVLVRATFWSVQLGLFIWMLW